MTDFDAAMLGPGRPEVGCDECFHLLDQYVERDHATGNAATEFPQLAAHLAGCPVCQEEFESLIGMLRIDHGATGGGLT